MRHKISMFRCDSEIRRMAPVVASVAMLLSAAGEAKAQFGQHSLVVPQAHGVELVNQLCLDGETAWDVFTGPVWNGASQFSSNNYPYMALGTVGGRFGETVSMGDFDGDGHIDILVSASWANRSLDSLIAADLDNVTPAEAAAIDASDRRLYAGRVYLLYGPFGGGAGEEWPDRIGHPSKHAQNLGDLDSESNQLGTPGSDGWVDDGAWFSAFDITGEPRHEGNVGVAEPAPSGSTEDSNDTNDQRIPGLVIQGLYGFYENATDGVAVNAYTTKGVVDSPNFGDPLHEFHGETVNGWYGLVAEYDGYINWNAIHTTTTEPEYEIMGTGSRFVGDINGDGCDDILVCAAGFDEYDSANENGIFHNSNGAYDGARVHGLDDGRAYLVFGQGATLPGGSSLNNLTRYEGAMDIGDLNATNALQGVTFKASGVLDGSGYAPTHHKLGKDSAPAAGQVPLGNGVWGDADFNGDGIDDFIVGASSYDFDPARFGDVSWSLASDDPLGYNTGLGYSAVVFGKEWDDSGTNLNPWTSGDEFDLPGTLDDTSSTDQPEGVYFVGSFPFGYAAYVGFAGDIDGDGLADVAIGEPNANFNFGGAQNPIGWQNAGRVHVVLGRDTSAPNGAFPTPHASIGYPAAHYLGDRDAGLNLSVDPVTQEPIWITFRAAPATELDYDTGDFVEVIDCKHPGQADMNPGIPQHPDTPSSSWVITENSIDHLLHVGLEAGWATWTAGDVDNDGKSDLLIGAPDHTSILSNSWSKSAVTSCFSARGRAYLVYGFDPASASEFDVDLDTTANDSVGKAAHDVPTTVAIFRGESNGDRAGEAVMGVGDADGDGFRDDFVIGADWADHPGGEGSSSHLCWTPPHGGFHGVYGHKVAETDLGIADGETTAPSDGLLGDGIEDHLQGHVWFDLNDNGVRDSGEPEALGHNGDGGSVSRHRDLGAAYLIYGGPKRFYGDLELSDVGQNNVCAIPGVSYWGLTGKGYDELHVVPGETPKIESFAAPMFGYSIAGGAGCDLGGPTEPETGIAADDFIIGIPKLVRPTSYQPFPQSASTGGFAAVYGQFGTKEIRDPCQAGALTAPEFLRQFKQGIAPDLNGDGVVDLIDVMSIRE